MCSQIEAPPPPRGDIAQLQRDEGPGWGTMQMLEMLSWCQEPGYKSQTPWWL